MSLYKEFKENIKNQLKDKLWKTNIHEVPVVDKVIVSMWIWSLATRKGMKDFWELEDHLSKITWQKPAVVKSKKAISNFKLREDMPVMLRCTLRWKFAYDFIEKLTKVAMPRVRDFEWIYLKNFDWKGNYNIWFKNQAVFAELNPEEIKLPHWVQVNIVTTTDLDKEAIELLKVLWFVVYAWK